MKRMNNKEVKQMLTFFSSSIDFENLNLDDAKTYELFQNADTDGIYMMESEWDKYDLLQIKPQNIDELTATIALSHGVTLNPYIYTYLKIQKIHPFTYPQFTEMDTLVSGINYQNLNWPSFSGSNLELSICLNNSDRGVLSKRTSPTA